VLEEFDKLAKEIGSSPGYFTRELIFRTRKEKRISVHCLSEKSGVSERAIAYLEAGEFSTKLETYIKLAKALKISKKDLSNSLLKDFENQLHNAINELDASA
jgi:transcriptional regulator with XRE-family HTH domain